MKIKHNVSSHPSLYKVLGNFFCKISWNRKTIFFGQIYGRMFYMGTNDQIMQGGKLMVKRFQRSSQVSFPHIDLCLGYWYIIWKANTTNKGLSLKNTFCTLFLWGWGFHVKPVFFFKKFLVVICSLVSWLEGSFRFTYLWTRVMEKWIKALHSELEVPFLRPRLLVKIGSNKYQTQWLLSR